MKIFLSHSFDEKDREIVEWFKNFIQDSVKGSEVVTGKPPELKQIWEKIDSRILSCTAIVGVLTADIKVEGRNEWRTKGWILTELAYAFGKAMPSFAFVEQGVRDVGTIGIKEYICFDRNNLERIREEGKIYLNSALHPFEEQTYGFESYHKRTCIHKNGHGICDTTITLHVTSKKFSKVRHSFSLGSSAKKDLTLLEWNKLRKSDLANRFKEQTFYAKILDSFRRNRRIGVKASPKSSAEKKIFHISFKPNLNDGEKVKYAWGWSSPGLFPVKKSDLKPRKRKENLNYVESAVVARHPTEELIFELLFENGFPLYGKPWVEVIDHNGNRLEKLPFEHQNQICYTMFTLKVSPVQWNVSYRARWRPK